MHAFAIAVDKTSHQTHSPSIHSRRGLVRSSYAGESTKAELVAGPPEDMAQGAAQEMFRT